VTQIITVVVPVYNESAVLAQFHERLSGVLAGCAADFRILYVDDGSEPAGLEALAALRERDPRVSVLELSRNFGKEVALSAGLEHAAGDAVILIDADLQDPPELIPEFIAGWREGYDMVYGQRRNRHGDPALKRVTAGGFYRLLDRLSDVEIPREVGDFRLLSRRAVDALLTLPERHRYMKGLYAWVGFPQKAVLYDREARAAGATKWNYWRLWNLALEGITSFSAAPLKAATYLGLATSSFAMVYGLFMLAKTLLFGNPVPGYPSLIIIVLFLGGVQLICLGIIGEYLARTYDESKQRALYFSKAYHPARCDMQDPAP